MEGADIDSLAFSGLSPCEQRGSLGRIFSCSANRTFRVLIQRYSANLQPLR